MRLASISFIVAIALMLYVGCSGTGTNLTLPGTDSFKAQSSNSSPACLGAWQIAINKITGEVDIYQSRNADLAINVLGFLEPPALVNLTIDFGTLVIEPENSLISVDVLFKHPIPDPVFNGFDVRGIVFGPDILNADGYTPFMNPDDFEGVPFGYQDGLLGSPNSHANYSDELNGYKYFCDDLDIDDDLVTFFLNEDNLANRGLFTQGTQNGRHMDLSWEGKTSPIDFFVFNYAVYANYDWPVGDPPIDLDNFSITSANSAEPFCFSASASENSLYFFESEGDGELTLDVEIWDWQGFDSTEVAIEAPEFGGSPIIYDATSTGSTSKSQVFTFTNVAGTPTSIADVEIMVTATDQSETFGSYWFLDLLPTDHARYNDYVYSVWYTSVPVSEESPLSFSVELDASRYFDSSRDDFAPSIITKPSSGYVYLSYCRNYAGTSSTSDYAYSTDSGGSWNEPYFVTYGASSRPYMSTMGIDAAGDPYHLAHTHPTSYWGVIARFSSAGPNSGLYVINTQYGSAFIFTYDGHPVPVGDISNTIRCKKGQTQNSPISSGGWPGNWHLASQYTVAPSPARLS